MANPITVDCPQDEWVKVATNVRTGAVKAIITGLGYMQTYRKSGELPPTDETDAYDFKDVLKINDSIGIDVYIKAKTKDGKVRVDVR